MKTFIAISSVSGVVATGVVEPKPDAAEGGGFTPLTACPEAGKAASLVVAGCHSLVQIDGKTFGDPLEQAAMMGVKWRFNPKTQTALPTEDFKDPARDKALADAEARRAEIVARTPPGKPQPPPVPRPVPPKRTWRGSPSVKILVRNHFSSALQRMSTVAAVSAGAGGGAADWVCLKGSPEMVATLLKDKPRGYDAAYRALAEEGMRVIALAHRPLGEGESARVRDARNPLTRAEMERDLIFDGFLAFACATRVDTADVVQALKASAHSVMMATGDSALTALHVANEVGIAAGGLENGLMLARVESGRSSGLKTFAEHEIYWTAEHGGAALARHRIAAGRARYALEAADAEALHDAGADQHLHAGREGGDERADREDHQRRLHEHLLAEEVGELAPHRRGGGHRQQGGHHDPGVAGLGAVEVGHDARQRVGDHGAREHGHEHRQQQPAQRLEHLAVRHLRLRTRRRGSDRGGWDGLAHGLSIHAGTNS